MKHIVVTYDEGKWCAVPANNGGCGPIWQWGNELLIGYTCGQAKFAGKGHQVDSDSPYSSCLARSKDGGQTWETWQPADYQGSKGYGVEDAVELPEEIDFTASGFVMRIEGNGYHNNSGHQWFYSLDKGVSWRGPYTFGNLLEHPELAGKEFTGRTAYIINSSSECLLFLSARESENKKLAVSISDKVFLAKMTNGGKTFEFVSWVVPPSDPFRAVMPVPVRISADKLVAAIRRRNKENLCWIDCYYSANHGQSWSFLSRVGDTGGGNGNPPAMIKMKDGRLCCVFGNRDRCVMLAKYSDDEGRTWGQEQILRDNFKSLNGYADLGYPRLFQRPDGKLIVTYFWCSPTMPQTHIEATIFSPEN